MLSPKLTALIEAFRCLPGVGAKSAQRMSFHLLQRDRIGAKRVLDSLETALADIGYCGECRMLCEDTLCPICANPRRDNTLVCIVQSPADVMAIEASQQFKGLYFVLMGQLSPLDGMGPAEIGLDVLHNRFKQGVIKEVILATSPTVEGEATAHYIAQMARECNIITTRIAQGVPMGGELEYVDVGTLAQAFLGRREY